MKEYLSRKGVAFVEKNIGSDSEAIREMVETYRSQATPTVVIDGQVVIGFHRERIDKLLAAP